MKADEQPATNAPSGGSGIYNQVDQALTGVFGPINRGIESVIGKQQPPSWRQAIPQIMMGLGARMPGMMPRMAPRMGNQPVAPPSSNDLILQMLQQRANPRGVLQSTRSEQAAQAPFRGQTFEPTAEALMRPVDAMNGTRVLTPANRSPDQTYNLAIMNQLRQ